MTADVPEHGASDPAGGREIGAAAARPAGDAAPPRRRLPSLKTVGALLAALASVTTVLAFAREQLVSKPPAVKKADITRATVTGSRDRLGDYLRDTGQSTGELTREQLREEGITVQATVRIEGSLGEKARLAWSLYRGDGARLEGATYNQVAVDFEPKGRAHEATVPLWLPYPPTPGIHFVRLRLTDMKGRPLDVLDTRRFRVKHVPPVRTELPARRVPRGMTPS
jgi:hypothetical protein